MNDVRLHAWPTAGCFVLATIACFSIPPTQALAASAGCTAANAGAFDQNVPANGANAVGIIGAFDQGDSLTITAAGNPNLATVQLLPSNTGIFGTAANLVQTVAINEAGVTGLGITLLASAAQAATLTITCVPVTAAAATPQSSSSVATAATNVMTPSQTSDAISSSTQTVMANRLPTTPAALPGAGPRTVARTQTREQASRTEHVALWDEFQKALNDLYVRDHEEQQQFIPDTGKSIESFKRGIGLFDAGQPFPSDQKSADTRRGWTYGRDRQAIIDKYRKRFEDAGLPMSDPRPQVGLPEPEPEPDVDADPEELGDGDIVLFTPDQNGRGVNFEISTDALRRHFALRLDDTGTAPTSLPSLTIAGMPVNIWARGRGTLFDRQKRAGYDGWAAHLLAGAALRLNDVLTVGAYGSYLAAHSDTDISNTKVDTTQAGAGAYMRYALMQGLSVGLSANRETGEQDIKTPTGSGSADIDLWSISSSVQGAVYLQPVLLSPSLAVTYSHFQRDGYTDSRGIFIPGASSGDTTVSAALTASRSYAFENGWLRRVTPRLNGTVNYFAREDESYRVSATEVIESDRWGANLGAGVTLTTSGSSRISFDAGVIGIGQNTLGYTGQLQVHFGF
ncbi:autotransporter domain-containing protein [Pyruvatibacter sp.]|uniref:autotransporter domain-containing protein n=1 Tax=Pyruvatibacter sp. TaxID=1981328 RepID=UPI0032ECD3A6